MRKISISQIDAFTSQPFGGNPAGVVLDAAGLSDLEMQNIAREMNLSETAFLTAPLAAPSRKKADYRLRWFTPGTEVTFCGHATVATGHALHEAGRFTAPRLTFETLGGRDVLEIGVGHDAWKLGRAKVDDGVLVLLVMDDHDLRIEVGRGLEGALTDATSNRIEDETMIPLFKQGQFGAGINAGVDQIIRVCDGEPLPPPDSGWKGGAGALSDQARGSRTLSRSGHNPNFLPTSPVRLTGRQARRGRPHAGSGQDQDGERGSGSKGWLQV